MENLNTPGIGENPNEAPINLMPDENKKKAEEKRPLWREILDYLIIIAVAYLIALFMTNVVIINCVVPSGSMLDTIQLEDRVIGSRLSYTFGEPERGDIVIFYTPTDKTRKTLFIKRLIGLPGDTIEIKDNRVYVNGSETPLDEPYLTDTNLIGGLTANCGPFVIPTGEFFMLGDNRAGSMDSRSWGYVKRDDIVAKAMFTYWPFSDLTWLNKSYSYDIDGK